MSVIVEYEVEVTATLEQAWMYIAHVNNMPTWDPAVVECVKETPGEIKCGTTFNMLTVFRGQRSSMQYSVKTWSPPTEVIIVGSNYALVSTERITFREGSSPGTVVVGWHAEIKFRLLLAWLASTLRTDILATGPAAQAGMREAFAQGKHLTVPVNGNSGN